MSAAAAAPKDAEAPAAATAVPASTSPPTAPAAPAAAAAPADPDLHLVDRYYSASQGGGLLERKSLSRASRKKHGPFLVFHPNGALKMRAHYVSDVLHGAYEGWTEAGVRVQAGQYADGQLDGECLAFDSHSGALLSRRLYDHGDLLSDSGLLTDPSDEALAEAEDRAAAPQIRLRVRMLTGREVELSLPGSASVLAVKEALHAQEGVPIQQQKLVMPAAAASAASAFDAGWLALRSDPDGPLADGFLLAMSRSPALDDTRSLRGCGMQEEQVLYLGLQLRRG